MSYATEAVENLRVDRQTWPCVGIMKMIFRFFKNPDRENRPSSLMDLADLDPRERILTWPVEKQAWIEENRGSQPIIMSLLLEVLKHSSKQPAQSGCQAAGGTIVTGPISSIRLHDDGEIENFVAFLRMQAL